LTARPSSSESIEAAGAGARGDRRYAGKSRFERRAERRQQLIEAGLELFGTVGYRETTIEKVCSDAGVGIRAYYEEFGNRAALFRAVYDHVIAQTEARVEHALATAATDSPEERLGRFLRVFLDSMLIDARCGRVVSIESGALDREMDAHRNRTLKRFAALVSGALSDEIRRALGNVRLWSVALGGAVNEVVVDCLVSSRDVDIAALARDLTEIWTRTLRA
jgi:AcrR family transcriptional regulator